MFVVEEDYGRRTLRHQKDFWVSSVLEIVNNDRPFNHDVSAKRTYRELSLLIYLRHKNILSIQDVFIDNNSDFYLVTDFMEMDLEKLLATKKLEAEYVEYFLFQIMVYTFRSNMF